MSMAKDLCQILGTYSRFGDQLEVSETYINNRRPTLHQRSETYIKEKRPKPRVGVDL